MITALIVDDSKLARMVIKRALTELRPEWALAEASNAGEAMALAASRAIDIAFIDYNMAGKNGLELLADIRRTHPTLPAAIVTANHQDNILHTTRALGATFVSKPIGADAIRDFVESSIKA
jgi:DNA-binding NarL/FixJ family response regulator